MVSQKFRSQLSIQVSCSSSKLYFIDDAPDSRRGGLIQAEFKLFKIR